MIVLTAVVLVLPFGGAGHRWVAVDRSRDYVGRRIIEAVAVGTPHGATVLQHRSLLRYMTLVEGCRTDLHLVEVFPPGTWVARSDRWAKDSRRYLRGGPVYVLFPAGTERLNVPTFEKEGYGLVPAGPRNYYKVIKKRWRPAAASRLGRSACSERQGHRPLPVLGKLLDQKLWRFGETLQGVI